MSNNNKEVDWLGLALAVAAIFLGTREVMEGFEKIGNELGKTSSTPPNPPPRRPFPQEGDEENQI